ncbi:MAG: AAA family ATPase [Oscillospiraceae bacterium]|nr:AAA family ATPase [Oscillospiraceae bacterium]
MERVMIIGCCGSGKTTLARQLGEKTGLPVVHLDQIWWAPGNWKHMEREEFDRRLEAETAKARWILDGNFNRTIETRHNKCDTVIYLDLPRWVCLKSWLGRVIQNWGHARPDIGEGCAEWFDPEMARTIWRFNRDKRKRYYEMLSNRPDLQIIILRSRRQVRRFLESLE